MATITTPLCSLRVLKHQIAAYKFLPNTSIQNRPLIIYHEVFGRNTSAFAIEKHLKSVGVVEPQWRYTMYSTTHYHSTTHELLCISNGKAKLCFGGEDNHDRIESVVSHGDVVLIPAGVAHRLLEDIEGGFEMVGSYPVGRQWDMCYGNAEEENKKEGIQTLPWFERDPVYGDEGPALEVP